jgi:hypothetical protein
LDVAPSDVVPPVLDVPVVTAVADVVPTAVGMGAGNAP